MGTDYMTELMGHVARECGLDIRGGAHEQAADERLAYFYALLAILKRGNAITGEDVHDAWSAWTAAEGRAHICLVPFDQLSDDDKAKDLPYRDGIHRAWSAWKKIRP